MVIIEMILIAIGIVFMLASFQITERLTPRELEHLGNLSADELKKIIETELDKATVTVDDRLDSMIDASMDKVEIAMEKESNSKIMAISEYSDTVLDKINQNHTEVMFLYSMLNDKHSELTAFANQLNTSQMSVNTYPGYSEIEPAVEKYSVAEPPQPIPETEKRNDLKPTTEAEAAPDESEIANLATEAAESSVLETKAEEKEEEQSEAQEPELVNHNTEILKLYREGVSVTEIARKLGLGIGEVRLVLELYRI